MITASALIAFLAIAKKTARAQDNCVFSEPKYVYEGFTSETTPTRGHWESYNPEVEATHLFLEGTFDDLNENCEYKLPYYAGFPDDPTGMPSLKPTSSPTKKPTEKPTLSPTGKPTSKPTKGPTRKPTVRPTTKPTAKPTVRPTTKPTAKPTVRPTTKPTAKPTVRPTTKPTTKPTARPTTKPTTKPTARPTGKPTAAPVTATSICQPNTPLQKYCSSSNAITPPTTSWTISIDKSLSDWTKDGTVPLDATHPLFLQNMFNGGEIDSSKNNYAILSRLYGKVDPSRNIFYVLVLALPGKYFTMKLGGNVDGYSLSDFWVKYGTINSARPAQSFAWIKDSAGKFVGYEGAWPITFNSCMSAAEIHAQIDSSTSSTGKSGGNALANFNIACANFIAPAYVAPTAKPTFRPTLSPTRKPTVKPTAKPTARPTSKPTFKPTSRPTSKPTTRPTSKPTFKPTAKPNFKPTLSPTRRPTVKPTARPTGKPTARPTGKPTVKPTARPTGKPTVKPTARPTGKPTVKPTARPTGKPTVKPTARPTGKPTVKPTARPTGKPTVKPTARPTGKPTSAPVTSTCVPCTPTSTQNYCSSSTSITPLTMPWTISIDKSLSDWTKGGTVSLDAAHPLFLSNMTNAGEQDRTKANYALLSRLFGRVDSCQNIFYVLVFALPGKYFTMKSGGDVDGYSLSDFWVKYGTLNSARPAQSFAWIKDSAGKFVGYEGAWPIPFNSCMSAAEIHAQIDSATSSTGKSGGIALANFNIACKNTLAQPLVPVPVPVPAPVPTKPVKPGKL